MLLSLLAVATQYAKAVPTGWHGNWTSSWGSAAERTSVSWYGGNHIIAFNSVQKWSPARGTTNGSTCEVLFGTALVRGALSRDGSTIIWDNGSKWFREGSKAALANVGAYASYSYGDAPSEGSMRWGGGGGGGGDSYSYGPLPSPGAEDYGSYYSYYDDASASYSYAPAVGIHPRR